MQLASVNISAPHREGQLDPCRREADTRLYLDPIGRSRLSGSPHPLDQGSDKAEYVNPESRVHRETWPSGDGARSI
jgi:hypothetical protein